MRLPSGPVIVVHMDDKNGRTLCNGKPMPAFAGEEHKDIPRHLCEGCLIVNTYANFRQRYIVSNAGTLPYPNWKAASAMIRSIVTGVLQQAGVNPAPFVTSKLAGHWAGRVISAAQDWEKK